MKKFNDEDINQEEDDFVSLEDQDKDSNLVRPTSMILAPFIPADQQSLNYYQLSDELDSDFARFLARLEIKCEELTDSASLLKLFQQEMSSGAAIKWASMDHVLEKLLQWPLLSLNDIGSEAKSGYCQRLRPAERSILLKKNWGLVKAYGAQGFARGLQLGIFTSVHLFIYAMLLYRLVITIQTGSIRPDDFRSSFTGSDQKGIDSLVYLLAHLKAQWLELILTSPLIIGAIQGLSGMWGARPVPLEKLIQAVDQYLISGGSFLRDGFYEFLPGISSSSRFSLSGKLSKLEGAVRWDGRLTPQERKDAFNAICRVSQQGKKNTRLHALEYLTKIAHGIGFNDLPRLKTAGYTKEELTAILYTKGQALKILESELADDKSFSFIPLRIYKQYLHWWLLGLKTNFWRQNLPFFLFKAVKLTIELYFFQMILLSILEAIRCPDKPGFELGFGYPQYADTLTLDCYLQMIDQFRDVNLSDSVQQLVAQTQYFNLKSLNSLELYFKNLTGEEMVAILKSAETRGAQFTDLEIYDNFADSDMEALSSYLNTSNLQMVQFGCYDLEDGGGRALSNQGLGYLTSVLPFMTPLTYFSICFPNVNDAGIEQLADILNTTSINLFYVYYANIGDIGGIKLAQALATMPIRAVMLNGFRIGDGTIQALADVVSNSPALTELWVEGDLISNEGAIFFAQIIQNSSFLEYVGLKSINITDEGVIALANVIVNPPLQSLAIGSCSDDAGIVALINQLNKTNLWVFSLWFNSFTTYSMEVLATVLPSTQITELVLGYNNLNNPELVEQLARGVAGSSIERLNIYNNDMSDSLASLGLAFSNSKLVEFQVTEGNVNDAGLIALAPFLLDSSLQEFLFVSNPIGDNGILAIANILPSTNIIKLTFTNGYITDIGAEALAAIYSATHLQTLYLMGNNISNNILYQVENFQWETYCQNQLCHANAQYNGGNGAQSVSQPKKNLSSLKRSAGSIRFEHMQRGGDLPSSLRQMEIQTELLTSSANHLQPILCNVLFNPATFAAWSKKLVAEAGLNQYGVERFALPGPLNSFDKALIKPIAHCPVILLIKIGSLAALQGCLFQGLATASMASGYSFRRTQMVIGVLQASATIALFRNDVLSITTALLPFMAGKIATIGMQYHFKTRPIAVPAGIAVSLLIMLWQQATPTGLFMLGITLMCCRNAERFTQAAIESILPFDRKPLDEKLVHGKIVSLQKECRGTELLLNAVHRHSQLNLAEHTHHLQELTLKLNAIIQSHHATLKMIIELRQEFRCLQLELKKYQHHYRSVENSCVFFPAPALAQSNQAIKPSYGCLERIRRKIGL